MLQSRKLFVALPLAVLAVVGVLVVCFYFTPAPKAPVHPTVPTSQTAISTPAVTVKSQSTVQPAVVEKSANPRSAGSPLAAELNAAGNDATHDVETLQALLRQYLRHLHHRQGRPIGNDSDLAYVLTGHNPMKLVVLPPDHPALGKDGRLRDRWGTPYFIHPRGYGSFEIRSAGPDRKLFTADDLVSNPGTGKTEISDLAPPPDDVVAQ